MEPVLRYEPTMSSTGGQELSALAWSYAAVVHLGLPVETVLYPGSYQGWAPSLLEAFSGGQYVGVPLLQVWGMTVEPRNAASRGVRPYPHILRWLR